MPIASFCSTPIEVGAMPFYDGEVVLVNERAMRCFTRLTQGSYVLDNIHEGDTIWVGHELAQKTYFKRSRVTLVERYKDCTRVRYGEYFVTLFHADAPEKSFDGSLFIVHDEAKLQELLS